MGTEERNPIMASVHGNPSSALSLTRRRKPRLGVLPASKVWIHNDSARGEHGPTRVTLFLIRKSIVPTTSQSLGVKESLRARGALISEPRFSTPCEMRFLPREKGKKAFVEGFSLKRPFSLSRVGKIASR